MVSMKLLHHYCNLVCWMDFKALVYIMIGFVMYLPFINIFKSNYCWMLIIKSNRYKWIIKCNIIIFHLKCVTIPVPVITGSPLSIITFWPFQKRYHHVQLTVTTEVVTATTTTTIGSHQFSSSLWWWNYY